MDHLKMYFLLNMGIFHCHVSLPEGINYVFAQNLLGRFFVVFFPFTGY